MFKCVLSNGDYKLSSLKQPQQSFEEALKIRAVIMIYYTVVFYTQEGLVELQFTIYCDVL